MPASSINLGVLGPYAGLSRNQDDVQKIVRHLESQGMQVMPLGDVLAKLEAVFVQGSTQRMAARMDWSRFRSAYPHLVRDVRFMDLMSDRALSRGSRGRSSSLRATLVELGPDEQRARVEQELTTKLAGILDVTPEKIDPVTSIDHYGLDSLMLTDLQIWVSRLFDVNLPLIKLLKGPSLCGLSQEIVASFDAGAGAVGTSLTAGATGANFTLADVEGVQVLNPWLIRGCSSADAPFRLVCFHSMGVGASLFTNFLLHPPEGFDVVAIQTPGRENRSDEPVVESVDQLADQIVAQLEPLCDRPVVIWGHSYGGIVAREVIRRLQARATCDLVHFVVTGTISPHLIHLWQKREVMLKAMVSDNSPEYLISLSRYVDDAEFLKSIIPLMRRDWPLLKNYCYRPGTPLHCPITAFAARQDDMVYTDEIGEWRQHTLAEFRLLEVDGDHWFLNRNRGLISAVLQQIAKHHQSLRPDLASQPTAV